MTPVAGASARPAMVAIARHELRRRWPAVLAFGLVAGLIAGAVVGALQLSHRTSTAYARLADATKLDDARLLVLQPDLAERAATLPEVQAAWIGSFFVGKVDRPGVVYSGIASGPPRPADLFQPVVIDGRAPDPSRADEVLVLEEYAHEFGLRAGDPLTITLLTGEEVQQFDTGFGEPDGARLELHVAGLMRLPPSSLSNAPILGGPAFYERNRADAAGEAVFIRLRPDATTEQLARQIDAINREAIAATGDTQSDFLPLDLMVPREGERVVRGASNVLVAGLALFALIAALAGTFALAQAMARHQAGSVGAQQVEAALGLTRVERTAARVVPAGVSAAVAVVVTVLIGLLGARLEPPGALGQVEPTPGPLPVPGLIAAGAAAAAVVVVVLAALSAWRAGRVAVVPPVAGTTGARVARRLGRPTLVAGVLFTLLPGRGDRSVPVRSAVLSAVLGVAGLVAAVTFTSSLHRLETEPARWGWSADFVVTDSSIVPEPGGPDILQRMIDDPRLSDVAVVESASVVVDHRETTVLSVTDRKGALPVSLVEGRLPRAADEVAVGTRVANDRDLGPGDTMTLETATGDQPFRVVGIDVLATGTSGPNGSDLLVTADALHRLARTSAFQEGLARVAPGQDRAAVVGDYVMRYESRPAYAPTEVTNLAELGSLPMLLGGFLALIGAAALAHALVLTVSRRGPDLAVLRALGFTPRQLAATVAVVALTTVAIGLAIGIPAGLAIGRFAWWIAATDAAVATDVAVPAPALLAVLAGVPAVALIAASIPSWRAAALHPGPLLHAE